MIPAPDKSLFARQELLLGWGMHYCAEVTESSTEMQSQPGQSWAGMTMCFAVVCMLICVCSIFVNPVCDRELPPPPPIYVLFRTNARCHGFVDRCLTTLLYAIGHVTYVPLCNCWLTPLLFS